MKYHVNHDHCGSTKNVGIGNRGEKERTAQAEMERGCVASGPPPVPLNMIMFGEEKKMNVNAWDEWLQWDGSGNIH